MNKEKVIKIINEFDYNVKFHVTRTDSFLKELFIFKAFKNGFLFCSKPFSDKDNKQNYSTVIWVNEIDWIGFIKKGRDNRLNTRGAMK